MSTALYDMLRAITTATITTILLKKGIRRCWIEWASGRSSPAADALWGPAFTLRFVPVREDLATPESWAKPVSTRGAIEEMPAGCIAVADAMGITSAGIFGDILTLRMMKRNVAALVTDGVVRDKEGVLASKLPVWCAGTAAPASVNGLTFVGWQEPIGCGGLRDLPRRLHRLRRRRSSGDPAGPSRFRRGGGRRARAHGELYRLRGRARGEASRLYPMNEETKARYAAWKKR